MSNLTMSNAQYARSEAGRKKLASNLQSDVDKARNIIKGKELENLIAAIRKEWSGEDAEKFIQKINSEVKNVAEECNKYKAKIQSDLDNDANRFASMQNKNAGLF